MCVESNEEYEGLRDAGRLAWQVRDALARAVSPGVSVQELENLGRQMILTAGAESAPMVEYDAPSFTFISINEEVVHGLPSARQISTGDVVKIDVTVRYRGYIGDTATTVIAGQGSTQARDLTQTCHAALLAGLACAGPRGRVCDIGRAVQKAVRAHGFHVLESLCGHATGRKIHEEPTIPNFANSNRTRLRPGMVFTVEPIIAVGTTEVLEAGDGWTLRTADGSLAAHFEETVVITADGYDLLTAA